ncbi:hypothetical protein DINM_002078 [Dirofilaria immitis]|nr:hypothetical protein [Dirofilaria immitis]
MTFSTAICREIQDHNLSFHGASNSTRPKKQISYTTGRKCEMESGNNAEMWKERFATFLPEDLADELMKIEAFSVDETGKRIVAEPLNYALAHKKIGPKRLKELDSDFFRHRDLYILVLKKLIPRMPNLHEEIQFWNMYFFYDFFLCRPRSCVLLFMKQKVINQYHKPTLENRKSETMLSRSLAIINET